MVTRWNFFASFWLKTLIPLPWQNVFDVFKASTHIPVGSIDIRVLDTIKTRVDAKMSAYLPLIRELHQAPVPSKSTRS